MKNVTRLCFTGLLVLLVPQASVAQERAPAGSLRDSEAPRAVLASRFEAAREAGRFDVSLADAYLHALLAGGAGTHRAAAVQVYRRLLRRVEPATASGQEATDALRRHVAQLALLLPDDVLVDVIREKPSAPAERWTFREHAGVRLLTWWRSQDPVPATTQNERLEEHLERVAYAERHYGRADRPDRLDDRGRVYVRYGRPARQTSITYNDAGFHKDVFRFGVPVSQSDFPENAFWFYPHIDSAAYFIFVKQGRHFRQTSQTNDLLPSGLKHGFSRSERDLNRSVSSLAALRYIYRELALQHVNFGGRYDRVANYADRQEEEARRAEMGAAAGGTQRQYRVGTGVGQTTVVTEDGNVGLELPSAFVQQTLSESNRADHQAARARRAALPRQHTAVLDEQERLPLILRTARFLEQDGTTRTELYWSAPPGALALSKRARMQLHKQDYQPGERYLIRLAAVREDAAYRRQETLRKGYLLKRTPETDRGTLAPQTFAVSGGRDTFHLALQWEQYLARVRKEGQLAPGPHLKTSVRRLDTLQALRADEGQLEMSDLKPMVLPGAAEDLPANPVEAATPFPFAAVQPNTPLLLYFEIYHLAFGADDQARYSVEYEVLRRTPRGGLARLFRGEKEEGTATKATYTAASRTAEESILLDLSDGAAGRRGELKVVVRVTDEVTGQKIERSIAFEALLGAGKAEE